MNPIYYLTLRLLHIFGGVTWVGASFFLLFAVRPAVVASGPIGGRMMGALLGPGKLTRYLALAGTLTVLSGVLLYWPVSGGLSPSFLTSGFGLVLTIGALAGLIAWLHGLLVVRRLSEQLLALGQAVQAGGGQPTAEQAAEISTLQEKQYKNSVLATSLMALALIGMSVAEAMWF